jgi:hypothetical protein
MLRKETGPVFPADRCIEAARHGSGVRATAPLHLRHQELDALVEVDVLQVVVDVQRVDAAPIQADVSIAQVPAE